MVTGQSRGKETSWKKDCALGKARKSRTRGGAADCRAGREVKIRNKMRVKRGERGEGGEEADREKSRREWRGKREKQDGNGRHIIVCG